MKTVKEVSRMTGITVRTLHHYDTIGLLRPSRVTDAGYRLYDDAALQRLQAILLLRELEFPLKEIRTLLDAPDFDANAALADQIRLLELRRERLDRIIDHARQLQRTGGISMDFNAYDHSALRNYEAQARARWGKTDAWREFEEKTAGDTAQELRSKGGGLMDIFAQLGAVKHLSPASAEAQALVQELQQYITDHFYTCTKPILRGLGQMYIAGDSMTENIDHAGGPGTARFAHDAINIYCQ